MSTTTKSPLSQPVKIACIQLLSGKDKPKNLLLAREKVLEAAQNKADIVVLPECFNSPYGCEWFDQYAEPIPPNSEREAGVVDEQKYPSFFAMRKMAIDANVYLVAGSIPERSNHTGKEYLFNTSLTFNPQGSLIGVHRKIHLFDIDIPGKFKFTESDVLSPGHTPTVINLPPYGSIGVQICYDIRFPELSAIYARKGAFAVVVPGAFNLTTGPLHWELLARGRATDNQVYVAMCSPARSADDVEGYKAWGESMVVDPMGKVLEKADGGKEGVVYAELKPEAIENTRAGIPVTMQRRWDVYPDVSAKVERGDGLDLLE
ncbi:nitrilase family protein-like protein [Terfezia claveryi]|nr:nitrilase family protein-like protein [Terfezia claveryi]